MDINIVIKDEDVLCLENDLLDVEKWVQEAVKGKIHQCKKRMISQWVPKLLNDPEIAQLPASESDLIGMIIKHKEYKNRSTIELEANKI